MSGINALFFLSFTNVLKSVFVLGKPFQLGQLFVGKAGAYPSDMLHSWVGSWPYPQTLNIRLGWKGLPRTNTLAYYKHSQITEEKSKIRRIRN